MQKIIEKCDKCNQPTKTIRICDNCGKEIVHEEWISNLFLTLTETTPDGNSEWLFEFCSIKCIIEFMQSRTITDKEQPIMSFYDWENEIKKKFNIENEE